MRQASLQRAMGGLETAHRRTGPWTVFLAEFGHVFQIADQTSAGGILGKEFWGQFLVSQVLTTFEAEFWSGMG